MKAEADVKQQVREFYDQIGWQLVGEDLYQNARYEDLRPVSSAYIHRCHLRVGRHLKTQGKHLLDAGSGPLQYPEYLEYSRGYQHRVCADISIVALQGARQRLGGRGLYVVADIANLPFKAGAFDGVVSLHTIHHLPEDQHLQAYTELNRVLASHSRAVVVNGWPTSRLMQIYDPLIRLANRIRHAVGRLGRRADEAPQDNKRSSNGAGEAGGESQPKGTFTSRHDVAWMKTVVGAQMPLEILVWRSVSVRFLRALVHDMLAGRAWLKLLYWLEERFPHFFGENGQYPLIVIRKDGGHI